MPTEVIKSCRRGHICGRDVSGNCFDCLKEVRKPKHQRQLQKKIYSVGYNSSPRKGFLAKTKKEGINRNYDHWRRMLQRCYDEPYKTLHTTYEDCVVVEEWHDWQNFAAWCEKQTIPKNSNLDKDLIVPGNKLYASNTCCFLPEQINKALITFGSKIARYRERDGYWEAYYRNKYIGASKNIEDLIDTAISARLSHIKSLIDIYRHDLSREVLISLENIKIIVDTEYRIVRYT